MKFSTLLIDPPWRYGSPGWKGGAERHYETVSDADLMRLPVSDLAEPNAHVWVWATDHHLTALLPQLIHHWGFTKRGIWPWVKLGSKGFDKPQDETSTWVYQRGKFYRLQYGNGYYGRSSVEYLVLATRGVTQVNDARHGRKVLLTPETDLGALHPEPWAAPIGEHSEKPEASYDLVRAYSPESRLELFSRTVRDGFQGWGAEYPIDVPWSELPELDAWRGSLQAA